MARSFFIFWSLIFSLPTFSATIAIIDTGFDLDHDFLRPKILKQETDEEAIDPKLIKEFHGWNFHDNSHLKKSVIEDPSSLQEVLLYRNLRAKGHSQGLSLDEFEWFKKRTSDKIFMEKVRAFKKHSHGTFVAGIALREGENISIIPIRGINIPSPVVAVEVSPEGIAPLKGKTPEEKFREEIRNSLNRVSRKFSKLCRYLSEKKVNVINASYGITYKNIKTKFRENYKILTGTDIDPHKLENEVSKYFNELYARGIKTVKKYPHMLFVFSAGNSGLDNEMYHHYPSKIKLPNSITVAAMNGDYLASFSNYGPSFVDIGAPGVAVLSLIPKVYTQNGSDTYSPSSGTSMAAPYISNIAAQVMNANPKLTASEVKKIILETGDEKSHLKTKLSSSSIVNNQRAIKAALISKDMILESAISLAKLNLIPMEDSISFGQGPAISPESIKQKVMESIPQVILPHEVEDEPSVEETPLSTKPSSLKPMSPAKEQPDNSMPPSSIPEDAPLKSADPDLSNQTEEQSLLPFEGPPASSSPPPPSLPSDQSLETSPSLPQ